MSTISTLTIVFIILKVLGVVAWSWLWVLSPLWISAVISLSILTLRFCGLTSVAVIMNTILKKTIR